ncbi:MAG: hypothetical protein HY257_04935 [Chloroflexi bacterium]|nr:hypothetical protein [Chloroflexota bacterium]
MKFAIRLIRFFLALGILAALTGLSWSIATWVESKTPPPEPAPPRLIPDTDVNPYGANFFLDREVEDWKRDRTVRMARDAGIVWAKQQFSWEEIEKRKNNFDWDKTDQMVTTFERYNLQIIARLDRTPVWARRDKSLPQTPPDDFNDYGDFIDAFVRRYKGRIHYIQIWNEPNVFPEWGNRPADPNGYVDLLKIAYARAKNADASIRILSAPLAITLGEGWSINSPYWKHYPDLDYLDAMYQAGAQNYFDILSANAFGLRATPDDPPDSNQLNFQRVALAHAVMERYGDTNKAIWINEYGWNASPADFSEQKLIWGRVTEQQQAEFTLRGIQQARANWNWVGVFNIWYFRQVGDVSPERADYYFRIVDVDFTPRLIYNRLKEIATAPNIARTGLYQETNPAVELRGNWQPRLDARARGSREMVTRQPGARAVIRFIGDGVDLFLHRHPEGGRAWIVMDGQRVAGLPLDSNGNSYVDLASPKDEWQVRVSVKNLARGTHTLELIVAGTGGEVTLDGFTVSLSGDAEFPFALVTGLSALLLIVLTLFVRTGIAARK